MKNKENKLKNNNQNKKEKGITLVALVITVVVMLILAGVAIAAIVDGGGLFNRVRQATETYENAADRENAILQNLIDQIEASINGTSSGGNTGEPGGEDGDLEIPGEVSEITVKLANGMVPVKYNEGDSSWYVATEEEISNGTWYDYVDTSIVGNENKSKWANIMLRDNLEVEGVRNASTATLEEMYGKKVTSEGSMYVWIPRYAYKIASGYHTDEAGEILIKFLNTDNTYKDGSSMNVGITNPLSGPLTSQNSFVVHPAFSWEKEDGTPVELEGIWVGKFEASSSNASYGATEAGNVLTSDTVILRTVGNVSSWRSINRNNIFLNCYNMNSATNASIYGISTNKDEIDPHLIKNVEWGAAAYLAHSAYGRNGTEVTMNSTGYYTGNGNYKSNVNMSTTGNVYGIYDMAGGAWEHVAAYVDSAKGGTVANIYLTSETYGKALYDAADKYKDVYKAATPDDYLRNYGLSAEKYGDGIFETSVAVGYWAGEGTQANYRHGWFEDYTFFPFSSIPFFYRGGGYYDGANAGVFAFADNAGNTLSNNGFRAVLATL